MTAVLSLVGYANSGKTTVMEGLIRILKRRGYTVAAIKHAAHGYTVDAPGTDSWHYAQAGADKVIIAGPESLTIHEFYQNEKGLVEILDRVKDVDIILIEGFKNEPGPKIEIYRKGFSTSRIAGVESIIAVVSDEPVPEATHQFSFTELEELADFITNKL